VNQFFLTVKIGTKYAAINVQDIKEILRPLALEPFANLPPFVLGLSMIRGLQIPVISLKKFLEGTHNINSDLAAHNIKKLIWVTLNVTGKPVAMEVDSIAGIFEISSDVLQNVPPLIAHAHSDSISSCGVLDHNLLLILQSALLIPGDVWQKLDPLMSSSLQKEFHT
jgi:chemotaxis signal transduction protein